MLCTIRQRQPVRVTFFQLCLHHLYYAYSILTCILYAEAAWDEAQRVDANYADAFFLHGQMLASSATGGGGGEGGRWIQAEELLRTAIGLNKSHVPGM